jgi:hypothetical protein
MIKIYKTYPTKRLLAEGTNLKDACLNWEAQRDNNDDLWRAFKESNFYNPELDFDEEVEMYNQFIESLTGEEMFDIMRDGTYTNYEEVK